MVPPCTHDFLLNLSFGKAWVQGIPVYACLCPKSQLHDEGYWHRGSTFRSQLSSLFWSARLSPQTKIEHIQTDETRMKSHGFPWTVLIRMIRVPGPLANRIRFDSVGYGLLRVGHCILRFRPVALWILTFLVLYKYRTAHYGNLTFGMPSHWGSVVLVMLLLN